MAKSVAEQLRDTNASVISLTERELALRREVDRLATLVERLREEAVTSRHDNAVLRQQVEDHLKQVEEWDRRRWGLILLLIGAIFSLASGLIVTLARK